MGEERNGLESSDRQVKGGSLMAEFELALCERCLHSLVCGERGFFDDDDERAMTFCDNFCGKYFVCPCCGEKLKVVD